MKWYIRPHIPVRFRWRKRLVKEINQLESGAFLRIKKAKWTTKSSIKEAIEISDRSPEEFVIIERPKEGRLRIWEVYCR